jgi:hypothetical protein
MSAAIVPTSAGARTTVVGDSCRRENCEDNCGLSVGVKIVLPFGDTAPDLFPGRVREPQGAVHAVDIAVQRLGYRALPQPERIPNAQSTASQHLQQTRGISKERSERSDLSSPRLEFEEGLGRSSRITGGFDSQNAICKGPQRQFWRSTSTNGGKSCAYAQLFAQMDLGSSTNTIGTLTTESPQED